jgi:2,3-bisphosphoglycerate-dependent phosphoglycerate mutase
MSEEAIVALNIPTAIPLVYEFDKKFRAKRHYYLGDAAKAAAAANAVANQGKTA